MKQRKHFFNEDTQVMKRLRLTTNKTQVNEQEEEKEPEGTLAEAIADGVVDFLGSWIFVLLQISLLAVWGVSTLLQGALHWDLYPFIAANVLVSAFILMSHNRQAVKDRLVAEEGYHDDLRKDHQLNEIKAVLHTILDTQRDQEGKLQILYSEIQALKRGKTEMAQERHRLDQIFAVQSTVTRIEGITKEVQLLAQAGEERRLRRSRLKEARMHRREVERLAEEIATIVHSMQGLPSPSPSPTTKKEGPVDPETAELLPYPPIIEEHGIANTQPMKRVEVPPLDHL